MITHNKTPSTLTAMANIGGRTKERLHRLGRLSVHGRWRVARETLLALLLDLEIWGHPILCRARPPLFYSTTPLTYSTNTLATSL